MAVPGHIIGKVRFGLSPDEQEKLLDIAIKMFAGCKNERTDYEGDFRVLSEMFMPNGLRLEDNAKSTRNKWGKIINNTGLRAVRTVGAGMQSGMTSPGRPWVKLGIEDFEMQEDAEVKEWLEFSTQRLLTVFRRSNMYGGSHQFYKNIAVFGTAAELQLEDFDNVMDFTNLLTGSYWIGNNARGRVDRLFVRQKYTVVQMVEKFGIDNVDPSVKLMYQRNDFFQTVYVNLGIFPNPYSKWAPNGEVLIAANQKPFVSVYWVDGQNAKRPLKTSGFNRFPGQVARWDRAADEAYGSGCGIVALGDTRAMQLKEREKAKGLQKMINPPVSAPSEMRQGQYPISGLPGGITYRPPQSAPDSVRSMYEVNLPLQYLSNDIILDEERVNSAFYVDLFMMISNSVDHDKTAFEVARMNEEKLQALGPVTDSLNNEYLDPKIERAIEIMMDADLLPPPPPQIQGKALKVEYIGVLAQAQQMVGIGGIERFLTFTGNAEKMFPGMGALDQVNIGATIQEVGTMIGVPTRLLNDDNAIKQIQDARAQEMAQQQQAQTVMAGADVAQKLGSVPMGEGNLLERFAGQA